MQWQVAASFPAGAGQATALGFAGPVCGVHGPVMLVAGGANFPDGMPWLGGKKKYYDDVYVFKKKGDSIVLTKGEFKLPSAIAYAASCSVPNGILYAGGENDNGISNKVWLLQWNEATSAVTTVSLADLPIALTNAAVTVHGNMVYLAGGETAVAASDAFYCLDLSNTAAGWMQLPSVPIQVSHTVLGVLTAGGHGSIYLAGGRKKNENGISDLYSLVYAFNIEKNQWIQKKSLPYRLCAGTGVAVNDSRLIMFGGDKGETFHRVETLIAAIGAEQDPAQKAILLRQKNDLQSKHPGFSKEVLIYDAGKDQWKAIGSIPYDAPVTTTAFKWGNDVIIPSGEIRAGVRTPNILKVKLPGK
ncbi:MAG: galactose oxidase [Bacteroidota bacterium]